MPEKNIAALASEGVYRTPYDFNRDESTAVDDAVAAWKAFCALEEARKKQMPYRKGPSGMGCGYELKKTEKESHDLKEDFHFAGEAESWIAEIAQSAKDPVVGDLVTASKKLLHAIHPLVEDFAQRIETEFSLPNFASDVMANQDFWYLRFLHYFGNRKPGDVLATAHADKDGFTPSIYESDPGLQYFDRQKRWRDMPVAAGETAIIPGMRLQYRSKNLLKATYHRVVATEKTAVTGRYSIVCFVHPANTPAYDKDRAGRLQEFPPGFNYDMPFDEFRQLFMEV